MEITVEVSDELWERFRHPRDTDESAIRSAQFCMTSEMRRRINDPYLKRDDLDGENRTIYNEGAKQGQNWARTTREEYEHLTCHVYYGEGAVAAFHYAPNDVKKQKVFAQGWQSTVSFKAF